MADQTGVTLMVDRGGRRVRYLVRQDPMRPGIQERRRRAEIGQRWCSDCRAWLPIAEVRQGRCREHRNEAARRWYAERGAPAVRQRVRARRRDVAALPLVGIEYLTDQFTGPYCPAEASSWDHVVPVSRGGRTEPGNVVPACLPCNSSKNDGEVFEWLARTSRTPKTELLDVLALIEEVAA
jgi:5-methylcytosine-specific restriction endonuclease McrA